MTVEDAEDAARSGELGGTVMMEPFDVMEAGRMALLQDPTGAVFAIWQPRDNIGANLVNGPGRLTPLNRTPAIPNRRSSSTPTSSAGAAS